MIKILIIRLPPTSAIPLAPGPMKETAVEIIHSLEMASVHIDFQASMDRTPSPSCELYSTAVSFIGPGGQGIAEVRRSRIISIIIISQVRVSQMTYFKRGRLLPAITAELIPCQLRRPICLPPFEDRTKYLSTSLRDLPDHSDSFKAQLDIENKLELRTRCRRLQLHSYHPRSVL